MRTCQKFREIAEQDLSSMASGRLGFNRVEKRGNSRCAAQSQKHQTEVIRKNKMRHGHQDACKAASAKIWQHGFDAFAEWQPRVFQVRTLQKTTREQHERHQSDAVRRCPEMQFDQ